jgi:hypothetical protein
MADGAKASLHRSGHEDVKTHTPDRRIFPLLVHLGDRVAARWSVEDVHLLRPVGGRPYDRAMTMPLSRT